MFALKLRNTLINAYILRALTMGLNLVFFYYLLKQLPIIEVGLYNWVTAVLVFGGLLLNLGVEQVLIREFSSGKDVRETLLGAFKLRTPIVALSAIVFIAWFFSGVSERVVTLSVMYMSLFTIAHFAQLIFISYLRSVEKQNTCNLLLFSDSLLRMCAGVLVIGYLHKYTALAVIISISVVKVFSLLIIVLVFLRVRAGLLDIETSSVPFDMKQYTKSSLAFMGITSLTAIQSRADWLLIDNWLGKEALANYAVANKVFEISVILWGTLLVTTYPWQCRMLSGQGKVPQKYKLFFGLSFLGAFFSGFFLYIIAPEVIVLIFGDKYEMSLIPLKILSLVSIFSSLHLLFYNLFTVCGLEKVNLKIMLFFIATQILLDIILIPRAGIIGASVAMLLGFLAGFVIYIWVLDHENVININEIMNLVMPLTIISLGFGFSMLGMGVWVNSLVITVCFVIAVFVVYLSEEDRQYVFEIISGGKP